MTIEPLSQKLLDSLDWLEAGVSSLTQGIVVTDATGAITFLNAAAASLAGRNPELAVGQPFPEIFPLVEPLGDRPIELAASVASSGVPRRMRTVLLAADGARTMVAFTVARALGGVSS